MHDTTNNKSALYIFLGLANWLGSGENLRRTLVQFPISESFK